MESPTTPFETVSGQSLDIFNIFAVMMTAPHWLKELDDGGRVEGEGEAFGACQGDIELRADRHLGQRFRETFSDERFLADVISVEGLGDYRPEHALRRGLWDKGLWYCVDPIDGSLNYRMRMGSAGLPHASCVTVLKRRYEARFSDVLIAAVADLRNNDWWSVRPAPEGGLRTSMNGHPVRLDGPTKLDIGKQIVFGEAYYPENREKLARAFAGKKGWLRNPGSAAYEMALVASGTAAAFICDRQKHHELGAGYALVKGAGGVAVDWNGVDIGTQPYDFNDQSRIVLAANQAIADQVLELLLEAG